MVNRVEEEIGVGGVSRLGLVVSRSGNIATFPEGSGLPVGIMFSTLVAGNMSPRWSEDAKERRQVVLEEAGLLSGVRIVTIAPQSKSGLVIVRTGDTRESIECDGLMTDQVGVALELRPADCYPVFLTGHNQQGQLCIALLHAGRTGLLEKIVLNGIRTFCDAYDISPEETWMVVGPGICSKCYRWDDQPLDLFSQIRAQARMAGFRGDVIFSGTCTCCGSSPKEFSNVRSKEQGEDQGRFTAIIGPIGSS